MRKKLLSLILVGLGVLVLLAGLASATLFKPETTVSLSTPDMKDSAYVTASAEVLALVDKNVTVQASAPDDQEVTVIIGRTVDIAGWIGDNPSYAVTGAADWESLTVDTVAPAQGTDSGTDASTSDPDTSSASPSASEPATEEPTDTIEAEESAESDMWTQYYTAKGRVDLDLKGLESGMSLLAISSGTQAPTLTATWERDVTTPLLVPALVAGGVLLLAGVAAFFLAPAKSKTTVSTASADPVAAPFGPVATEENQAFSSVGDADTPKARTKKPSKLASLKRERVTEPKEADTHSVHSASDAFKFSPLTSETPLPSGIAVNPVPAQRVGGSHASAVSTHSADSASERHNSTTPSPNAVRKALEEPNLDTAALMQLGLTRRQLREMREAKEAAQSSHTAIPTVAKTNESTPFSPQGSQDTAATAQSASSTPSTLSQSATSPEPAKQAAQPSSSRTSGSNWRAAWGVRSTTSDTEASVRESAFEAFSKENRGTQAAPSEAITPAASAESLQDKATWAPFAHGEQSSAKSVREPASWWSKTPQSAAESAGSFDAADGNNSRKASERTEAAQSAPTTTSPAAKNTDNLATQANDTTVPEPRKQPSVAAPGTRRALYSNYRAEAERLSAQEDWPVPAPQPNADNDQQDGGRK